LEASSIGKALGWQLTVKKENSKKEQKAGRYR